MSSTTIAADAVDHEGFPPDKSETGGWVPAALILGLYSPRFITKPNLALPVLQVPFCFNVAKVK